MRPLPARGLIGHRSHDPVDYTFDTPLPQPKECQPIPEPWRFCRDVPAETSGSLHLPVTLDCPIEVESLSLPARKPCVGVDRNVFLVEQALKLRQGVLDQGWWWRNARDLPTLRPEEAQLATCGVLDPISLLVHGPMMATAEKNQVVEACFPSVGPVFQVMSLAELQSATRKLTTFVPHSQCTANWGGNRTGSAAYIEDLSL